MTIHKGRYIFTALAGVLLLFLAACSPSTGTTNRTSSLTVAQVLQNSVNTMKQLKTVHFNTTTTGNAQTATSTSTPTANNITFNLTGKGDQVFPDQQSVQITLNSTTNLAEIIQGDKVYIQNTKGQWYVIDKSQLEAYTGNPFTGTNLPDMNQMLAMAENAKLTDHGLESLNGQELRHITVTFDKASFKQFLTSNSQLKGLLGKQNIDSIIDNTRAFLATLDLWIDESSFYLHRTELKLNLDADLSSLKNSITPTATVTVPSSVTTKIDSIVDLSKFNQPVTITPPTNAIPTNNPMTIFGQG